MTNRQFETTWDDQSKGTLKTQLIESETPALQPGEILVKMLYVPMHGSFWLATHPDGIHPRKEEFLSQGRFVFGNGGVAKVVDTTPDERDFRRGDYVCIFGHIPCRRYDCYACTVLHRYSECDFGESSILGHGKDSAEGTYAEYAVLPRHSYEICFRKEESPSPTILKSFMFGFLFADVRNALTRHMDSLRMRRMLLVGAGFSGMIAAYIHNRTCPESKIFVVDSSVKHLANLKSIDPEGIETYHLPNSIAAELNSRHQHVGFRHELSSVINDISEKMHAHFGGRGCNLLFDSSSGNTTPIWDNPQILSPTAHCIPFGFGSQYILLSKELIQMSGLTIMMSRGVGNIRNRKEVIELIKAGAAKFIDEKLLAGTKELEGIDDAAAFVDEMQDPPRQLHEISHAYISFK
jgi:threonine dehydrogenase-like Zn-dependent dehydrogenase